MTHSLYWAYMDPGVNPQVRSESLVNFGRIAAGHSDRVDIEGHRTLGERARFLRSPGIGTVEPAIGRPLRLVDDPTSHHPVNRRRPWNPRFRNLPAESIESPPVDVDDGPLELDEDIPTPAELQGADVEQMPAPAKVVADVELKARGIKADDMMSPADHKVPVAKAVARAKANAHWWQGLTQNQQQALIHAYPHQVGNAEGIPPMARHQANSLMLQRYLRHRDILLSRRDNGVALNRRQERYLDLMTTIEDGMRVTQQQDGPRRGGRSLPAGAGSPGVQGRWTRHHQLRRGSVYGGFGVLVCARYVDDDRKSRNDDASGIQHIAVHPAGESDAERRLDHVPRVQAAFQLGCPCAVSEDGAQRRPDFLQRRVVVQRGPGHLRRRRKPFQRASHFCPFLWLVNGEPRRRRSTAGRSGADHHADRLTGCRPSAPCQRFRHRRGQCVRRGVVTRPDHRARWRARGGERPAYPVLRPGHGPGDGLVWRTTDHR